MSSYQDYLIADLAEGTRQDRESWLIPNEAFSGLENVFMRRGIIHKRYGYSVFGQVGTFADGEAWDTGNDGATYNKSGTAVSNIPIIAGSLSVIDATGVQTITDDGDGTLSGDGTGTVDYITGEISVTFTNVVALGDAITVDYHYSDTGTDRNIRGIFNLENAVANDACVVCDRDNASVFDNTYGYFKNIPLRTAGTYSYFNNKPSLMWGTGYKSKLFMCDGITTDSSGIWIYDPSLGTDGEIYQDKPVIAGNDITSASAGTGDGTIVTFTHTSGVSMIPPVEEGTFTITDGVETFTDDGLGVLTGDAGGTGTITYSTGNYSVTFNTAPLNLAALTKGYTAVTARMDYSQIIIPFYQRLVVFKTKETENAGSTYTTNRQRARWCKINDPTKWRADKGGQGSSIDAATNEVILSAALIKGSLIVAFEHSIWSLDYTGNHSIPFRWRKLAGNIEINTVYGVIKTEDMIVFVGHGGIYGCDGLKVERIDGKIPDFTDEDINLDYINSCYGVYDKKLDQALLSYTSLQGSSTINDKTLVFSIKDGWFSQYSWGMNCLGNFIYVNGTTWTEFIARRGTTWATADIYGLTWKELYQQGKEDTVLGGTSNGYVHIVNNTSAVSDMPNAVETSYNYSIKSKRFTPFIAEGQKVTLGYIDFLVNNTAKAAATLFMSSGESSGIYITKSFNMQSDRDDSKIWKRINIRHDANNHSFEMTMTGDQMADDDIARSGFKLHAINLGMRPSGRTRLS